MKILYLSYDWRNMSAIEPAETLRRLTRDGLSPQENEITLLQISRKSYRGSVSSTVEARTIGVNMLHARPFTDAVLGIMALRLCRKERFDAIVCADPSVLWWTRCVRKKPLTVLFMNTLHRTLARRTRRWLRYWYCVAMERLVRSCIDHCLVLSNEGTTYAATYLNVPLRRIHSFVPNTFDELLSPSDPEDIRSRYSISKDTILVLSVSRLEKEKGVDRLITYLANGPADTRCLIVGEGSQYRQLQEECCRLGIERRAHFVGSVAHKNLASYYFAADVVAQFSRSESLGLSVLEAMLLGVPVMVSPVGGLRDSIGVAGERGFSVEDQTQWNVAIEKIKAATPQLMQMKHRAKAYVQDRRSAVTTINQLLTS